MRLAFMTPCLCWLLLAAGCAARQKPELCFHEVTREKRPVLSPEEWFALLVHGYSPEQRTAPQPTLDCSGSPVVWQEPVADACREAGPEPEPLPATEQLTEDDLILETVRSDLRLVWVLTRRFANGEALGPVGLVERTDQGLIVRALGSLRSFPQGAKLQLKRSGDVEVLVAEGDQCTNESPPVCRRFARLLPLRHGRFFAESVVSKQGQCLGPTWFPLSREQLLDLPGGLQRKVELTSNLRFGPEGIIIDEQVMMHDMDPHYASLPPMPYRRAQAERKLTVENNRLVGTEPSLWVKLLEHELQAGATPLKTPVLQATPAKP
ncbi:MAG TPA: hypothetical protein VFZ09_32485 [Archangium sp.]|uniref:hypothetical protein n=1 Tax=Archangium sp. TaxID=1872627 RepID=UPI002E376C64|nr:hypothetical protein [Archangium sp.]HEX5750989.1 hypothetical protein [Archangium sp.]